MIRGRNVALAVALVILLLVAPTAQAYNLERRILLSDFDNDQFAMVTGELEMELLSKGGGQNFLNTESILITKLTQVCKGGSGSTCHEGPGKTYSIQATGGADLAVGIYFPGSTQLSLSAKHGVGALGNIDLSKEAGGQLKSDHGVLGDFYKPTPVILNTQPIVRWDVSKDQFTAGIIVLLGAGELTVTEFQNGASVVVEKLQNNAARLLFSGAPEIQPFSFTTGYLEASQGSEISVKRSSSAVAVEHLDGLESLKVGGSTIDLGAIKKIPADLFRGFYLRLDTKAKDLGDVIDGGGIALLNSMTFTVGSTNVLVKGDTSFHISDGSVSGGGVKTLIIWTIILYVVAALSFLLRLIPGFVSMKKPWWFLLIDLGVGIIVTIILVSIFGNIYGFKTVTFDGKEIPAALISAAITSLVGGLLFLFPIGLITANATGFLERPWLRGLIRSPIPIILIFLGPLVVFSVIQVAVKIASKAS